MRILKHKWYDVSEGYGWDWHRCAVCMVERKRWRKDGVKNPYKLDMTAVGEWEYLVSGGREWMVYEPETCIPK